MFRLHFQNKTMREIKFRAWHINKHIMASVSQLHWNGSVHVSYKHGEEKSGYFFGGNYVGDDWGKDDCVIMQFTGRRDDSGIDIYDGDIVSDINLNTYVVQWNDDTNKWQISNGEDFNDGDRYGSTYYIIGNIYENPDLIKKD